MITQPDTIEWFVGRYGVLHLTMGAYRLCASPFEALNALHAATPPDPPPAADASATAKHEQRVVATEIVFVPGPGVFL
ncbi:MAG TPA: hypothetical protein VG328_07360 [Stellaceae bacterium]|jgi:hypothetical protein|nr:hypothetical protein [Stellaceae bacterium]